MGQAHILWVYSDGLKKENATLQVELGHAVLEASFGTSRELSEDGWTRIRTFQVGHLANCVNHAAEVHSSDELVLFWSKNCLRNLNELTLDELRSVRESADQAIKSRTLDVDQR